MLPPPITMAISTPNWWTSLISLAMRRTVWGSMPKPCSPIRTSPLSFSRTLRYFGISELTLIPQRNFLLVTESSLNFGRQIRGSLFQPFAGLEPHEPSDADVFADLSDQTVNQLFDGLRRVLNEGLIIKANQLIVRLKLAFRDFIDNVFRLSRRSCLILVNFLFLEQFFGGNLVALHI